MTAPRIPPPAQHTYTHTHTHTHTHTQKGEEFAVKSVHQSVQKSVDEFNRISESILGKLQEYPEPPRSGPSSGFLVRPSHNLHLSPSSLTLVSPPHPLLPFLSCFLFLTHSPFLPFSLILPLPPLHTPYLLSCTGLWRGRGGR